LHGVIGGGEVLQHVSGQSPQFVLVPLQQHAQRARFTSANGLDQIVIAQLIGQVVDRRYPLGED
jgi:hypothetical protein